MVDTCAAEFKAQTPYFYSTYDEENEAEEFIEEHNTGKKKVMVFGSGPIRIGQGIEFDYCSCPLRLGAEESWAMRRSSPTTTRRPSPPTSTPPTGSTLTR